MGRHSHKYESPQSRKVNKRVKIGLAERILYGTTLFVSVVVGVCLLLTYLAPYISPADVGLLPLLALVAPITYIMGVILSLYWLARWRLIEFAVLSVILLGGADRISLFLKMPLTKHYTKSDSWRGTTKVISYNTRWVCDSKGVYCLREIAEYLAEERADIICLQEFPVELTYDIESHMPELERYNWVNNSAIVIGSRYPILSSGQTIDKDGVDRSRALWADLLIGRDTVRIFNNHLQSTTITANDSRYLTSTTIVRDSRRLNNISDILGRYQESCVIRSQQVDIIAEAIKESPYDAIVCGDFNDTPASYAYNTIAEGLNDAFRLCGNGYSYTYQGFFNMLRIDFILSSPRITPKSYLVDSRVTYSDHLPVVSRLKIQH